MCFYLITDPMQTKLNNPKFKWAQKYRFAFAEAVLKWEGRLTTARLIERFNISKSQSSIDFRVYKRSYGKNIKYDVNEKGYFASDHFFPVFHDGTLDEYLELSGKKNRAGDDCNH